MNIVLFLPSEYNRACMCWASVHCMCAFRGPILWCHDTYYKKPDACTEDQSYGSVHVGSYMYLCMDSSEGSMSSMKDQLYGNSTCTYSTCQKEYLYRVIHRESVHQISGLYKHAQQHFNKWNRMHVHVTMFASV